MPARNEALLGKGSQTGSSISAVIPTKAGIQKT